MKHKAQQFEIPGAEIAFNLTGEIIQQQEPKPKERKDDTIDMFEPKEED